MESHCEQFSSRASRLTDTPKAELRSLEAFTQLIQVM